MPSLLARLLLAIAILLLLALAYTGIAGGLDQFDQSTHSHYTIGQYEKCGYNERGRAIYRGNPLIYYELVLA